MRNKKTTTFKYEVQQLQYKQDGSRKFEQSLDVYKPRHGRKDGGAEIVVVLVLGSGWLGHCPLLYHVFNWWNAGGPQTICSKLGYTCISVRHSGGFFRLPRFLDLALAAILISAIVYQMHSAVAGVITFVGIIATWVLLAFQGPGASLEDMMEDVASALDFVRSENVVPANSRLVIGGYSSGAHVLATLLHHRPETLDTSSNAENRLEIVGILYLSGVLSLKSPILNLLTLALFGKHSSKVPQPYQQGKPPNMPHLLIGCEYETFGIPILDETFCVVPYSKWLSSLKIPVTYKLVPSDHWNILASQVLAETLETELLWFSQSKNVQKS